MNLINNNFKDLTGIVFERLTVLSRDYGNTKKGIYWLCQCDCICQTVISVISGSLVSGNTKSCGCLQKEKIINLNKLIKKKFNTYDLSGEYGIGYTFKGKEFYFDLEDYDLIKDYCWSLRKGYVSARNINVDDNDNTHVNMHRLIMNAKDNEYVDHIFHNITDNRKSKLRLVSDSQNQMNRIIPSNNKSGVKGVCWDKEYGKWVAYITVNKKVMKLGRFYKFEDAVKSRKNAENKYCKEYSYDNSMIIKLELLKS